MLYYFKGCTAYELQIWRFGVRWVHLRGGRWTTPVWWPFGRVSFAFYARETDR